MGGNAIKKNGKSICGRLSSNHYNTVKNFVLQKITQNFVAEIVLELPGKEDFGDMDILVIPTTEFNDLRSYITTTFNINDKSHIVSNGYVMSFALDISFFNFENCDCQYFQIDLLRIKNPSELDMARFYFSFGDIGAIIGRISNWYGMKFGDAGLWIDVFESTVFNDCELDIRKTVGKIMLSNNPREICNFLGYDYDFWKNTIPLMTQKEDHIEIFKWLSSSRFFDKTMFSSLNHDHRERFIHRPFYKRFVMFIMGKDDPIDGDIIMSIQHGSTLFGEMGGLLCNKQSEAIKYFQKENEVSELVASIKLREERQSKFSTKTLIDEFQKYGKNLDGKEIGIQLSLFKDFCKNKYICSSWEEFVDNNTKHNIDNFIMEFTNIHHQIAK
jgi:hypothetical protein